MQETLIFTDLNEELRASYTKHVKVASIALISASAIYGIIAALGVAAVLEQGSDSDDILVLTGFVVASILYSIFSIRKWAHVTYAMATVLSIIILVCLMGSAAVELLERVVEISLILLGLTAGQVVVVGLVARGFLFARKLRKLKFEIYPQP